MGEIKLNKKQLHIILHALGQELNSLAFRNRYVASNGDPDLSQLVRLGIMNPGILINDGKDCVYQVSTAGFDFLDIEGETR